MLNAAAAGKVRRFATDRRTARRNAGGGLTFLPAPALETGMDTGRHDSERGRPASFDPVSGEVHGSGSGAGGVIRARTMTPTRCRLRRRAGRRAPSAGAAADRRSTRMRIYERRHGPSAAESDEARLGEVPESLERAKGEAEEGKEKVQPKGDAVDPDGTPTRLSRPDRSGAVHHLPALAMDTKIKIHVSRLQVPWIQGGCNEQRNKPERRPARR